MKKNVLIVGAGGVAQVVAHKCAQHNDRLGSLHIASRTRAKCDAIAESVQTRGAMKRPGRIATHGLDARDAHAVERLIRAQAIGIVINVGSAFVNMSVLSACIATGAAYIDTAIHEDPARVCETPPWYANYEWKRRTECSDASVTAVLGAGFDPGVVNAYARLAQERYFDEIDSLDIIDINAGSHDRYFATNFDPEINFREFTGRVWSWQDSAWVENRMFEVGQVFDLPVVGRQKAYLTGHDEVHSLSQIMGVPNVRFWMGFSDHYVNVFTVLNRIGLLSEQPIRTAEGVEVVPLKVVKAALPDPSSLAPAYRGKTCIGDLVRGRKDGISRDVFIYNVADHQDAFAEVGSQGISYTAGVPAVAAALLIADGRWDVGRMVNVEELPAEPFIDTLDALGLKTRVIEERAAERLAA